MSIDNNQQNIQLAKIETELQFIKKELSSIKDNHLNSIYKRLNNIETTLGQRPTWLILFIISGLISLLVALSTYLLTAL